MPSSSDTTIYALSSGPPPSGVAVIRLSGPHVRHVLELICGRVPKPRHADLRQLRHPHSGDPLDQALVFYFPGPRSFTGEDVAEFHVHGGRAVIASVLSALSSLDHLSLAEAGAFSRRAFLNGKFDLTEIEGLADLIEAETEAQRIQALDQSTGQLSDRFEEWRKSLITAIALVESALDFSDESDVPEEIAAGARPMLETLATQLSGHLEDNHRGEILREGFRVMLAGRPNAGKSKLLNALAKRDVAIVSEEAGTTRDVIEVRLDIEGLPIVLTDTAGIREAEGAVEQEGIRRSFLEAERADLILWLIDGTDPEEDIPSSIINSQIPCVIVFNKLDLGIVSRGSLVGFKSQDLSSEIVKTRDGAYYSVSALTGEGLSELIAMIGERARYSIGSEPALITRHRHRDLLTSCHDDIQAFLEGDLSETELRAEDLRRAAHALGKLTGKIDVEDVLDQIFAQFCIGK